VDPELKVTWSRDLGEKWSFSGMFAFFYPTQDGQRNFTWQPTFTISRSLKKKWILFLEYAGKFPKDGPSLQVVHHGVLYQPHPRHQLDFHWGIGVSPAAPDVFVAAGYSFRIDAIAQRLARK
jgi:hypothetical protein